MPLSRLFQGRLSDRFRALRLPTLTDRGHGPFAAGLVKTLAAPGLHERQLRGLFGGRLRNQGTTPIFPRPLIVVAFTNRSGSNLVCDYITQTGRVGGAGEFLNHDVVAKRCAAAGSKITSLPDYISLLHHTLAGPGRSLALKASWDQLAMLLRHNIPAMFAGMIVLHCTRVDTLAQAVSYAIALRSGEWMQPRQGARPPRSPQDPGDIPLSQIEAQIDTLHRANLLIRLLCDAHGAQRWEIGYERLCQDKGVHLARVLHAAGLVPPDWMPGAPHLEQQAGPLNQSVTSAFLHTLRTALGADPP